MTDFLNHLADKRKAAGWTQAQLADKMNVSRQTVSHWENGRMQPDEAAMHRLMDLFGELSPSPVPRKRLSLWLITAAVLVILLGLVLLLWPKPQPEAAVSAANSDLYKRFAPPDHPLEWYQTPARNEADKAYLDIVFREKQVRLSGDRADLPAWYINYFITEANGIPLTLTKMTLAHWDGDGSLMAQKTFVGEEIYSAYPSLTVTENDQFMFSTCIDVCGARWFTIYVGGVDEKGNVLSFGSCAELLDVLEPPETTADYRIPSDHLLVSFDPSPTVSFADDYYDRGEGFEWKTTFTNTGSRPLTVTHLDRAWFNGEHYSNSEHYLADYLAAYWQIPSMTIEPGQSIVLDEGMPIQYVDFTHIGYRVTAVDEAGNEYQAAALNEFWLREGVTR